MDDILSFKEKHIKVSNSQINDLLQKQVKLIDDVKYKQDHQCNENEAKIQELILKVASMKEDLRHEKQALEYKNHDLSKHLGYIVELMAEKKKFLEENQSLELERNKLKNCKRNIRDQELLNLGRRKFSLYRKLTRIRWDYEKLEQFVIGYVTDKKKYVHHFCYKNENMTDIHNLLWQEIYQSTIETENKENKEENMI
nr:PREDICTED: uncharacterized protein LOC100878922 [Megachile rotundata]